MSTHCENMRILAGILLIVVLVGCNSTNNSPTVIEISSTTPDGARYPNLFADDSGTVYLSWLQPGENQQFSVMYAVGSPSSQNSFTWSDLTTVITSPDFFVNWADFPSVVGFDGAPLAAHWLAKVPGGTYAYHVNMSFFDENANADADVSIDANATFDSNVKAKNTNADADENTYVSDVPEKENNTYLNETANVTSIGSWGEIITPHLDRSPTEHGFVSLLPLDAHRVLAVWLDGRQMKPGAHDSHDSNDSHDGHQMADLSTAMTLRSAEIHRNGTISRKNVIDAAVCECCSTSITPIPGGAVVIYRDRDEHEIRDISTARYDLESGTWSAPQKVSDDGWQIGGCPVNGPRISASGNRVAASWFTASDGDMRTMLAVSEDGGKSFPEPIRVNEGSTIGRTDIHMRENGDIWVSWMETSGTLTDILTQKISADGTRGQRIVIASPESGRRSGFPRMVATRDGLLVAWTETQPNFSIKTALVAW